MLKNNNRSNILELNQKILKLEQEQEAFRQEIEGWKATVLKDMLRHSEMIKSIYDYLQLPREAPETLVSNEMNFEDFNPDINDIIIYSEDPSIQIKSSVNFVEVQDNWKLNENVSQELLCYYCGTKFQKARALEKHLREDHGAPGPEMNFLLDSKSSVCHTDILKASMETCEISEVQCTISSAVDIGDDFGNITVDLEPEPETNILLQDATHGESVQLSKDVQQQETPQKEKGTSRFVCTKNCGKSFKHLRDMKQHVDTNCGMTRNFKCAICYHKFARKCDMKLHILEIHFFKEIRNEQLFECPDCGLAYRHRRDLVRHQKTRCGTVKNFECDICKKKLSSKYHIREHLQKLHFFDDPSGSPARKKPMVPIHNCHKCGRKYFHRRNLLRHLYSFCGTVKRFSCTRCNARFTQKSALPRHMRNVHNIFSKDTSTT